MSSIASEGLLFFALVINGGLAGGIFALGEWIMFGSLLASTGSNAIGLDLGGAVLFGCVGMALLGVAFNAIVLGRLVTRPVISVIMVTLGLGALMRGVAALCFRGVPSALTLPVSTDPVSFFGIDIAGDKLFAASIAAVCVCLVSWFFRGSRTGIALRAIADDQQAALAAGIDIRNHFALVWAATGVISVIAGILWTFVAGGGFWVGVVGLDSVGGSIVAAMIIGVLESLGTGYLDPRLGGGFGNVACYLLLLAMLMVRPHGMFGRRKPERV